MSSLLKLPSVNTNDDQAILVDWMKADDELVTAGETVCIVETTKSTVDVAAEAGGYLKRLAEKGATVIVGAPIAALLDSPGDSAETLLNAQATVAQATSARRWTKKAELTAAKLGVDLNNLAEKLPGKVLNEADVVAAVEQSESSEDIVDDAFASCRRERVLLIGGASGGGSITLDALLTSKTQRAVAILDNNPATHGRKVMGVPVLGPNTMIEELWEKKAFDAAVLCITGNVEERQKLFLGYQRLGIRFTNVIDPAVTIKSYVSMGVGNLIIGGCYLAPCVKLGDNNFLASHTVIEHHSVVGSHCTFGPRSTTSGGVTIGNRVKFGMGVLIEPYLTIDDDSLIPSGSIVTTSVPAGSVLKHHPQFLVRPRQKP